MAWARYAWYADNAYAALMTWYDPRYGRWDPTFGVYYPGGHGGIGGMKWWHLANALNTVISYSALRPVSNIQDIIATVFTDNNSSGFRYDPIKDSSQSVYDDEAWWALTWLAAYDLVQSNDIHSMGDEYLSMAQTIFNDMSSQWTWECGGGLFWDKKQTYKNAIVNELFLTLAVRLHQRTNDELYLAWAKDEWNWFSKSGMQANPSSLINDGLNLATCSNNGGTTWTYNQGVILGGLADMYLATKDSGYLTRAWSLAQAVITPSDYGLVDTNGVLTEPAYGDDKQYFKGIFVRNLSYLCSVDPDNTHGPAYATFFAANANSLWLNNRNSDDCFGFHWAGPFDSADPARQGSALEGFVAALRLDAL